MVMKRKKDSHLQNIFMNQTYLRLLKNKVIRREFHSCAIEDPFLAIVFSVESFAKGRIDSAPCSSGRRELRVRGIRSIFKVTAIFDSYSPRPWFWRHLFHDPPASTRTPQTRAFHNSHLTHIHAHIRTRMRERGK